MKRVARGIGLGKRPADSRRDSMSGDVGTRICDPQASTRSAAKECDVIASRRAVTR